MNLNFRYAHCCGSVRNFQVAHLTLSHHGLRLAQATTASLIRTAREVGGDRCLLAGNMIDGRAGKFVRG